MLQARSHPWMPPVIMGLLSAAAGLLALILPETRWIPLPESIEEMASWKNMKLSGKKPGTKKNPIYKPSADVDSKL